MSNQQETWLEMRNALKQMKYRGRSKLTSKDEMKRVLVQLRRKHPSLPMPVQDTQGKIHSFLSANAIRAYSVASKTAYEATKPTVKATDRFLDAIQFVNKFFQEDQAVYYRQGMEMKNKCEIRISHPKDSSNTIDFEITIDDKHHQYDPQTYDRDEDTVYTLSMYYTDKQNDQEKKKMWKFPRTPEGRIQVVQKMMDLIKSNPSMSLYRLPNYKKISRTTKRLVQHLRL